MDLFLLKFGKLLLQSFFLQIVTKLDIRSENLSSLYGVMFEQELAAERAGGKTSVLSRSAFSASDSP